MRNKLSLTVDGIIYQMQAKGGVSRLYSEILPAMCDIDESLSITFITPKKSAQSLPSHSHITFTHCDLFDIQVNPKYLRPSRLWWNFFIPHAKSIIQKLWIGDGKGQIWHSTYYTTPQIWKGYQVVTVYDLLYERFAHLFNNPVDEYVRNQMRKCIEKADALICISNTTLQDLHQFYYNINSKSFHVTYLAFNDIFKLRKLQTNLSGLPKNFLLYVGDRTHYKNFIRLLDAYSKWQYKEDVKLVVVGRMWTESEKRQLIESGIQTNIYLLADINDEKLCQLYNQAVAFVYPSLYEGFGIPLLEAMACGCPIIASRIPSTIEVAGDCPIYFDPYNTDELINAFDIVLSEGRNSERVKIGLEKVKNYSWQKTAEQTLKVYKTLMS